MALASAKAWQWWRVGTLAFVVLTGVITNSYVSAKPSPAQPTQKIISLHLLPESLTLTDARDVQHVLVLGETESHQRVDLSATAGFCITPAAKPWRKVGPSAFTLSASRRRARASL